MHYEQTEFVKRALSTLGIPQYGMRVLDVGSLDVNGNNKHFFPGCTYIGIDIGEGNNVDVVSRAHEYKPDEKFDIVISTECFEHDEYWERSIENIMVNLLKPVGFFIFTCATHGRPEHGTRRSAPDAAPFIGDYYRNLGEDDITSLRIAGRQFTDYFSMYKFETRQNPADLYFLGLKTS